MNISLIEPAEFELSEAISYYTEIREELGAEFFEEVVLALDRISAHPEGWQRVGVYSRRCRLDRFPYGVIYAVEPDGIVVLAIAHLSRDPNFWRQRAPH